MMCGYFSIGFVDVMFTGQTLRGTQIGSEVRVFDIFSRLHR